MLADQGRKMEDQLQHRVITKPIKRERLPWVQQQPCNNTARSSRTHNHCSTHTNSTPNTNNTNNNSYSKRRKLHFDDRDRSSKEHKVQPLILDGKEVAKLNPTNPEEARRIFQRKRTVAYGKNTVGYDEYTKQVPRHKRKPRTLEHPTSPDAEADIPNRRWLGMVKAWRKALHKYDPPDLMTAGLAMSTHKPVTLQGSDLLLLPRKPTKTLTTQEQQIHDATIQGLPVNFSAALTVSEENHEVSMSGSGGESTSSNSDSDDHLNLTDNIADVAMDELNNDSFLSTRWADVCDSDSDDELL